MQEDSKKIKVKRGWLAIRVGAEEEDGSRFVIPISYLYHPLFKKLLERAHETYGYHASGPLRIPSSVDDFLHLRWRIEKESNNYRHSHRRQQQQQQHHKGHGHHGLHLNGTLSFRSC